MSYNYVMFCVFTQHVMLQVIGNIPGNSLHKNSAYANSFTLNVSVDTGCSEFKMLISNEAIKALKDVS